MFIENVASWVAVARLMLCRLGGYYDSEAYLRTKTHPSNSPLKGQDGCEEIGVHKSQYLVITPHPPAPFKGRAIALGFYKGYLCYTMVFNPCILGIQAK